AGDFDAPGRRSDRDRDSAPLAGDPRAGEPVLRLARGRALGVAPGTACAPARAPGAPGARSAGGGTARRDPRRRRRGPAQCAGAPRRGNQAIVSTFAATLTGARRNLATLVVSG